eukprot:6456734-Amphidinium_carterae.1
MFGLKTQAGGVPLKKPYKIVTTVEDLALHLRNFVCDKSHQHGKTQGSETVRTGNYTVQFCEEVMNALDGKACLMNLTAEPGSQLFSGKEKDGYTVDALETTGWLDLLEIDFQRKLRLCENHASDYQQLIQHSPQWTEPVGDVNSLYDEGEVSVNVTNALQDQEVPDFFATPVMKPLTLDARKIFDDPAHYQGWVDAVKAELKSFDTLGVKDDVPYQRYPNIISAQLVAT